MSAWEIGDPRTRSETWSEHPARSDGDCLIAERSVSVS